MEMKGTNRHLVSAALVTMLAFILYFKTLAPTVIWGDSAKLAMFVNTIDLSCRLEYHPLHTVVGLLFNQLPFGDVAYRLNLMSAFFGALTVGLMYLVIILWTGSMIAALGGSLSLAVSHVFWLVSVITESYTLFAFLMALMLWLSVLWDENRKFSLLCLASFVFGISLSNNLLMPIILPAFIYFFWSCKSRPNLNYLKWTHLSLCLIAGATIILFLAIKSILEEGHELLDLIAAGPFQRYYRSPTKIALEMLHFPAYLMYQFPIFGFVLGILGAAFQLKFQRRRFNFIFLILLSDVVFASGYMRQKQFYLLIPSFIAFSLWIGVGIFAFFQWIEKKNYKKRVFSMATALCLTLTPVGLYYATPALLERGNIDVVKARSLPYRDNARFFLLPDKQHEFGAERFGREVFEMVEPNSIVIADFTPISVLRYFQKIKDLRNDIWLKLIDFEPLDIEFIDRHINTFPIYLANDLEPDYNISALKTKYSIVSSGPIFRVEPIAERFH